MRRCQGRGRRPALRCAVVCSRVPATPRSLQARSYFPNFSLQPREAASPRLQGPASHNGLDLLRVRLQGCVPRHRCASTARNDCINLLQPAQARGRPPAATPSSAACGPRLLPRLARALPNSSCPSLHCSHAPRQEAGALQAAWRPARRPQSAQPAASRRHRRLACKAADAAPRPPKPLRRSAH